MSGGSGGGVVIIQNLVQSGKFSKTEEDTLRLIQDRSVVRCSFTDAMVVCRIVWKALRRP